MKNPYEQFDRAQPVDSYYRHLTRRRTSPRAPLLRPELARHLEADLQAQFTGIVCGEWFMARKRWGFVP